MIGRSNIFYNIWKNILKFFYKLSTKTQDVEPERIRVPDYVPLPATRSTYILSSIYYPRLFLFFKKIFMILVAPVTKFSGFVGPLIGVDPLLITCVICTFIIIFCIASFLAPNITSNEVSQDSQDPQGPPQGPTAPPIFSGSYTSVFVRASYYNASRYLQMCINFFIIIFKIIFIFALLITILLLYIFHNYLW